MKKKPRAVPGWDDYLMGLCFVIASKSKDPNTQHGAVIVDAKHRIQGTGYNGPPAIMNDADIDWGRPHKYKYIVHAEENAIDHCGGSVDVLDGSTIYVTGPPCSACAKRIITKRIRKIIFGPQVSAMIDEQDWADTRDLCRDAHISLEQYKGNVNWIRDRLAWMETNMLEVFQPRPIIAI